MNKNTRGKEISDFAKRLRELAEAAPDGYAKRDLNRAIKSLRQRYCLSSEEKRLLILKLLADGLTTFNELLADTSFARTQLQREIASLKSDDQIREQKMNPTGGAGRPQVCYFVNNFATLENNSAG